MDAQETITQGNMTISPDLIKLLGKKLYKYPTQVILIRELLQNSIDAGSTKIDITAKYDAERRVFIITCTDNGCGMNEDVLLNVFLSIGASYKPNGGIGGFGIAKVAIFSCDYWRVNTGTLEIDSSLTLNRNAKPQTGTRVYCEVYQPYDDSYSSELMQRMIDLSYWNSASLRIRFNSKVVKPYEYKKTLGTGSNYRILTGRMMKGESWVIYRIRGLVQFASNRNPFGLNVLCDFNVGFKPSDDNYPFSLSRESVDYFIESQVNSVVDSLTPDKLSNANKDDSVKFLYSSYAGIKLERIRGSHFTQDAKRLGKLWNRIVNACGMHLYSHTFTVGLTQDSRVHAKNSTVDGESTIYLNPAFLNREVALSPESLMMILFHVAVHELTHESYNQHDESFVKQFEINTIAVAHIPFIDTEIMRLARYYIAHHSDLESESDNGRED